LNTKFRVVLVALSIPLLFACGKAGGSKITGEGALDTVGGYTVPRSYKPAVEPSAVPAVAPYSPSGIYPPATPAQFVTFGQIQQILLNPQCVSCHSGGSPGGGLDFTTYEGVLKAVVPGNPAASSLFGTANTGHMSVNVSFQQKQALGAWIYEGAPTALPAAPPVTPTYTLVQQAVLKPLCVSCHSGGKNAAAGGFDFTTYQGVVSAVAPGTPTSSLLYTEAAGYHMQIYPTAQQYQLLGGWILAGSPNN
jgi:hypothetical protein